MRNLIVASVLAMLFAQPVGAQSAATVAAAKAAARGTSVTLTGSIDRLPNGEYVLRDATDDIRLDLAAALRSQQEFDPKAEVRIIGRVDRTITPSDEIAERWPVDVKILVERLEAAQ